MKQKQPYHYAAASPYVQQLFAAKLLSCIERSHELCMVIVCKKTSGVNHRSLSIGSFIVPGADVTPFIGSGAMRVGGHAAAA